jgi:multicomponent Na+:H+ antiporter subunit C
MSVLGHYNYWVFIFLMMVGFYILISRGNLIKKIVGLNVFQTSVFFLYISMGKIFGGTAPILFGEMSHGGEEDHAAESDAGTEAAGEAADALAGAAQGAADAASHAVEAGADVIYSNPLPHVLILTAIVVGIATTAVALALVVRIHEAYGTIEEDEIHEMDAVGEA